MSLRFIYGRAGCGKTTWCLKEIKARIDGGAEHPLVLLVPEQFSFQAERDLISVMQTGGILKAEVLSFRRLAFRIFNEAGGVAFPHATAAGKSMIVYRILDQMKADLRMFGRCADRQGFVGTVSKLITEFKRYSVKVEDLKRAGDMLKEGNPLREKLFELGRIYSSFEMALAERYRDSDDDLTMASAKLPSISLYEGAEIWIDGFAGFTPQEFALVGSLLKKAACVNVCLCTDKLGDGSSSSPADTFSPVKRTYDSFVKLAGKLGAGILPEVKLSEGTPHRFVSSAELAHLERNYNTFPYKTYTEKTHDISLFSAVNMFSEVEAAAVETVRLCRDMRMRWRDIAIAAGDLETYGRLVETVFAEYGIPCFIDRKPDILDHPVVRYTLSMLDIFNEGWSYEAVFRYLKTGLTGMARDSIDKLENYVLACGIRGGKWVDGKPWTMGTSLVPGNDGDIGQDTRLDEMNCTLEELNNIRLEVTSPLSAFRERTRGRRKGSELCEALYDFLCSQGVPGRVEGYIQQFRNEGRLSLANEYGQIWNILMEAFDQVVEVLGEEPVALERFTEILRVGLGEYKTGLIPASLDQVVVGSLERTRSHEIKALLILGVNDGVFPSAAVGEGILSDMDREALGGMGIELASDTRTMAFDEQYQVYRALTTAGRYLRLSWPIADHEGRSMRPSMVVPRLRRLFPAIAETSDVIKSFDTDLELQGLTGGEPALRQMARAFRRQGEGGEAGPLWTEVYRWFSSSSIWLPKCRAIRSALLYRNISRPVGGDKVTSLYGDPAYSSVSRLEKYTSCPFAYYVQYGLNARERKVYRLGAPDIGTFMHAVIERFSMHLADRNISWREFDRDWCKSRVSEIVDGMLQGMKGSGMSGSKRYTAFAMRLKRVVARSLWLVSEHIRRSSFQPVGYELDFGDGGKFPPITIGLDSGRRVKLTGRIDRVDAFSSSEGTYFRIVDYKTGGKEFKLSDIYHGLDIQLITYMDAILGSKALVRPSGAKPDDKPGNPLFGGMLYFKVDDPVIRGSGRITEEELEEAIMKQLKMRGLLLADVDLIKNMDHTIDGTSMIIPARINKGDVLGKSSAATAEQLGLLRAYAGRLLKALCEEMMEGRVPIRPYKKKKTTSCDFCSYSAVCQFDTARRENTYYKLRDIEDDEVWSLLHRQGEAGATAAAALDGGADSGLGSGAGAVRKDGGAS